jgi:plastocyanin
MASKGTKVGVVGLALVLAGGIGYFVYSNSTTNTIEIHITLDAPPGTAFFTPANATVSLGQQVTMVIFNDDDNPHTFAIQAFNATTGPIPGSLSGRVSFVADKAGSFPFYSPLSADDAQGLTDLNGTLTVKV